jgi:site-specific recombinase XerD
MTLANKGVSQEVAAKYLGHKDLRSTGIYYRITNQRLDEELKKRRK